MTYSDVTDSDETESTHFCMSTLINREKMIKLPKWPRNGRLSDSKGKRKERSARESERERMRERERE